MNLVTLQSELENDPQSLGYTGDDVADAALLNATNRTTYQALGSRALLAWGAAGARLSKINDAANRVSPFDSLPASARSVAMAADRMLSRADTELDLANAGHVALVDALVASQVLTANDKAELLAMATVARSRADELGLGKVGPHHLAQARSID